MTDLSFGSPLFLWCLLLQIPMGMLFQFWLRQRKEAVESLGLNYVAGVAIRRMVMVWFGFAFLIFALARPRYGHETVMVEQKGRDIVVVLDASRSMYANDVSPNRMVRAQWELVELSKRLRGDRVGLVVFAGGAYPRMPLTRDYAVFLKLVKDTTPELFRWQGSDLASAIDMSVRLFDDQGLEKAILVVSDGEEHTGRLEEAAQRALKKKIRIYTLGVGTDKGGRIALPKGGFVRDEDGTLVKTKRNDRSLKLLSRITGGIYSNAVSGAGDIEALYDRGIKKQIASKKSIEREEKVWNEYFQWPLALGLFCMGLGLMRRNTAKLLLLLFFISSPSYAQEDWAERYMQDPNNLRFGERYASTLYEEGEFSDAHRLFLDIAQQTSDSAQKERALYNAALAAYQQGKLREALQGFQSLSDENEHAAFNAVLVEEEIQKRLQEESSSSQQGQQGSAENESSQNQNTPSESSPQEQSQNQEESQSQEESESQEASAESSNQNTERDASNQEQSNSRPNPTQPPEDPPSGSQDASGAEERLSLNDGEEVEELDVDSLSESGEENTDSQTKNAVLDPEDLKKKDAERKIESVKEGKARGFGSERKRGEKEW